MKIEMQSAIGSRIPVGGIATYKMVGNCRNCFSGPYLMRFVLGQPATLLGCPNCEVPDVVRAERPADREEVERGSWSNLLEELSQEESDD